MTQLQMLTAGMFCLVALMAAWSFRTSYAPVMAKIGLFVALICLAGLSPFIQYQGRDRPLDTTVAALPQCIDIVAFRPVEVGVEMWLQYQARIVRLPLDRDLVKVFAKVREALQSGEPFVRVCKGGKNGSADGKDGSGNGNLEQDTSKMHIDESLFLKNMKQE